MFSAQYNAIINCAKPRRTPTGSISVRMADVLEFDEFDSKLTRPRAQSRIAFTLP
jgi:hypothetical protein